MKLSYSRFLGLLAGAMLIEPSAQAIHVDEIVYQAAGGSTPNPSALSGTVTMYHADGILTINLKNTSGYVGTDGVGNLLTGIGFVLPTGMMVTSGSVVSGTGSTVYEKHGDAIGGAGFDISGEWGYRNNTSPGQPINAQTITGDITTLVAAMGNAFTDDAFSTTPVHKPAELAGPEFGLLSAALDRSAAGGQCAVQDSVIIRLVLSGSYTGSLVEFIDDHTVVLAFGSPDSSTALSNVTDSGATIGLLGLGLSSVGLAGRRRKSKN